MRRPPQSDHCPRLSVWKAQLKRSYEDRRSRSGIIVLSWRTHLLPSFLGVASPEIKWSPQVPMMPMQAFRDEILSRVPH